VLLSCAPIPTDYLQRLAAERENRLYQGNKNMIKPKNVDEYIAQLSPDVQGILKRIRTTIRKAAPDTEEVIKYQLPTFVLSGDLLYFGGFKNHNGFYPTPSAIDSFKDVLSKYKGAKGSVQFPIDKPIPYTLIAEIVRFRVKENTGRPLK
jgi:uncharacterized protein YdhG (YjbR/CyaY superfamily)